MPSFVRELDNFLKKEYSRVRNVYYFSIALMLLVLGWAIVDPFFSISMERIIQDTFLLGVFFGLWGGIRFFTDFIIGPFFDFVDNKKILVIAFLGYMLVGFGYYFINDVALLFALRVFHVLVGSFFWVGVWSYTHQITNPKYREESIMFESIMQGLPSLFAPLIGAFLFSLANPKLIFLAVPATGFLALTVFWLKAKPTKTRKKITLTRMLGKELKFLKRERKKIFAISYVMIPLFFVFSAFAIYLPIHLNNQGYDYFTIALFAIASVIPGFFVMPLGNFADRKGRLPLFVAGTLLLTTGLLIFYYSTSVLFLLVCALVIGTGFALLSPTANALVGDLSRRGERGVLSGVTETAKDIGQIIGPIFGGVVMVLYGFQVLVLLLSAVPVFILLFALVFGRTPKRF